MSFPNGSHRIEAVRVAESPFHPLLQGNLGDRPDLRLQGVLPEISDVLPDPATAAPSVDLLCKLSGALLLLVAPARDLFLPSTRFLPPGLYLLALLSPSLLRLGDLYESVDEVTDLPFQ